MKSQIIIGETFHILLMLIIILGVFALFSSISNKVYDYTTEKKMELILDKIIYNSYETCYESKVYNSTITKLVWLPQRINFNSYEIMGNGSYITIETKGKVLKQRLNAEGTFVPGRNIKISCYQNKIKID